MTDHTRREAPEDHKGCEQKLGERACSTSLEGALGENAFMALRPIAPARVSMFYPTGPGVPLGQADIPPARRIDRFHRQDSCMTEVS